MQVENADAARPQSGLSGATIIYEYVAEGGVSRFSAIYATPPSTRVGPVRSARLATLHLLKLYNGVLVYSGADQYIQGLLDASSSPHFDEDTSNGDLFRISDRSPPHNLYSDGARLRDLAQRATAAPIGYSYPSPVAAATSGKTTATFTVKLSDSEQPVWTWDTARHGWTRTEPDTGPFLDAVTGQPVVAATVIVQQVTITEAPQVVDVNGVHGFDHQLTGSGSAQVFVNDSEYDATWTQPASGPPALKLMNGSQAPIAAGLVWIELVARPAAVPH